jgi:tryptophanyl-tRNA synthetase
MTDKIEQSVKEYSQELKQLGIDHKIVEHPDFRTQVEVQDFLGLTLADGLSTMIMKADSDFVAIVRRVDCKLDFDKIKKILGVENLRMANPEEFTKVTHVPAGAAKVFNPGLKTILDKKLFEKEILTGGSGSFTCSFRYKVKDLKKLPESQIFEVTLSEMEKGKKRVFSGTRATGRLHLGNYLGAVKGYLELQDKPELDCIFMAVDVHTITTPYDSKNLASATKNIIMDYLACGLDPKRVVVTVQSLVPEHSELAFLFASTMSVARMQHLPTFKEKVKQHPDNVTMALLNYPILMASDILIYKAGLVPVGIDQEPHLEVAREIARKMNETYGTDFPEPVRFATKGEYVPSLTGEGKMSKSVEGSYINLTDDLKTIEKKLSSAPTDSGKGEAIPEKGGVANLFKFVELFEGDVKRKDYEKQYLGEGVRYGDLKSELAKAIFNELKPIQEKRKYYEDHPEEVDKIIKEGAEKASKIAKETVREVKQKMGFIS